MHARSGLGDGDRPQLLGHAHRLRALGNEQGVVARCDGHGGPRAQLPARVVALAHQEVRVLERAGGGAPALVAGDHLDAAVVVLDVQLAQQRRILAVVVAPPQRVHADEAGVPAGAEDRAEHVLAVAQERGDIVRRVLDPRAVVGPSGREDGVADARAVELHLQHAAGGRVEGRATHRARELERPSQVGAAQQPAQQLVRRVVARRGGHRRVVHAIAADPLRAPRARTRTEPRGLAGSGRLAGLVPDLDGPCELARGGQLPARVGHVDRGRRVDLAAVPQRRRRPRAPGTRSGAVPPSSRPTEPRGGRVDARHVLTVLAAEPDRAHAHPLSPVEKPLITNRWSSRKSTSIGSVASTTAAKM